MPNYSKDEQIENLIESLTNVKKAREDQFTERIKPYIDMRDGGDGGPWREGSETTMRELHFKGWRDSDFQVVLERLDLTPTLTEDEWDERFSHENTVGSKVKEWLGL
jgi:hypothetical protein